MGGGAHGHLGLVLTPGEYALVSPVPYVRHVHPGPLTIPPAATQRAAAVLHDAHKEQRRLFHEMIDL